MSGSVDVGALFRAHNLALFRYLVRVTGGDEAVATDAVQHAFLKLLECKEELDDPRAWLYHVATTAVVGWSSHARRRAHLMAEHVASTPVPKAAPSPVVELERAERIRRVRRALATLPEKERVVLVMRSEGFKHREIADAVGATTGSVGTMIARALEHLAARLPLGMDGTG